MTAPVFRDKQKMQAWLSDLTRVFEKGGTAMKNLLEPDVISIREGIANKNESQVEKAVDRLLTSMSTNQELLYSSIRDNDEFSDVLKRVHEMLVNVSKGDNEKSKLMKSELDRLALNSFEEINKDETKKRALLKLFFRNLEGRENFEALRRLMASNIMKEKTSEQILKEASDLAAAPYHDTVKRAFDTQLMHAFYTPTSAFAVEVFELFRLTVSASLMDSFPKQAPQIAKAFNPDSAASHGVSGDDQQMMPVPGKPGQFMPIRRRMGS